MLLAAMDPAAALKIVLSAPVDGAVLLAAMDPTTAWNIAATSPTLGAAVIGAMPAGAGVTVLRAGVSSGSLGPGTSLSTKLSAVSTSLQANKGTAACGQLQAFSNQVQAQTGKSVGSSVAGLLVQSVNGIRSNLGC